MEQSAQGCASGAPASVPRAQRSPCRSHHPAPAAAAAGTMHPLLLAWLCLAGWLGASRGCQLPSEGRPLSEGCHPKQAEITVYTEVLALYQDGHGSYRLPWQYVGLLHGAQVKQSGAACSRLKLTGQGYFSCHSHTVVQEYSYFFFLRTDEEYNL